MSEELEIWGSIPNTNGHYEISNFGNARCWYDYFKGKEKEREYPRFLGKWVDSTGYLRINVRYGFKNAKDALPHIFVATLFVENPNPELFDEINHKDGNKLNIHYTNLEWGTHSSNIKHAWDTGLIRTPVGKRGFNQKLTDEQALQIFKSRLPRADVLKQFNIGASQYHRIRRGQCFKHLNVINEIDSNTEL